MTDHAKTRDELQREVRALRARLDEKEQALRETRQRYKRLTELLPDAVSVVDMQGTVLYANEACAQLLGVEERAHLKGRSLADFIRRDDRWDVLQQLQRLKEGHPLPFEEQRIQREDGQELPVETAATPIQYGGREAILSTMRDLSGRKAMARALSDTQKLFYEAFHLGPAAISISRLKDGTFIDVNEEFLELTGYSRNEILGHSVTELDLWPNAERREYLVQDLEAHGMVQDLEAQIRRKDGAFRTVLISARHLEVHGTPCILACSVDVTERKRAERSEKESQATLQRVFQASPTAICISRLEDGKIIKANSALGDILGYDPETLIGRTPDELGWIEQDERRRLVEQLQQQGAIRDKELELARRDGTSLTVLGSYQIIQVNGERCILSVLSDITQRKEAERALREAKEHAEEMDRFKTSILENLTHEVRTPMTVILGFMSVLREGVRPDYERFVDLVERSGRRLLLMLDAILDLAQLEAGTLDVSREPFNIKGVVRTAYDELRPIAEEKGLTFNADLPVRPIYVRMDHEVLSRVLNNLIDNAIKFTDEGRVEIVLKTEGDDVYIHVRDTGVGIDPDYLSNIFDEFSQESSGLERSHQGSGLGLAVSKRLVELIGGSINVESEKGEGSEFTITLPQAVMEVAA